MNKEEFLAALKNALAGLPQEDVEERLSFYGEMIDDSMEEGMSEREAVAAVGSVEDIVSQTVAEIPLTKLVKEQLSPGRGKRAWEIVLLALGFPLWFPLLVAAGAVLLSLYVVLWALIVSLWAIEISLWAAALASIVAAAVSFLRGQFLPGIAVLGAGFVCAGLALFLLKGCTAATKGLFRLTKKAVLGLKFRFLRKERTK